MLTMKDIARELGISVATVSRALSDSPRISEERRRQIQAYAREHNFTPNVLAESLRHSRVKPMKIIDMSVRCASSSRSTRTRCAASSSARPRTRCTTSISSVSWMPGCRWCSTTVSVLG